MRKVLLVLIDGMRSDFINQDDSPILNRLAQDGLFIPELTRDAPFCERSEVYTGESAARTGNYAAFTYDPIRSPYRKLDIFGGILRLFDFVGFTLPSILGGRLGEFIYKGHKKLRRMLLERVGTAESKYSVNDIPSSFLPQFRLTEDQMHFEEACAFKVRTIFEELRGRGISVLNLFDDLRQHPGKLDHRQRLKCAYSAIESDEVALVMIANSEIDMYCHSHGVERSKRKSIVQSVDQKIGELINKFLEKNAEGVVICFSPHGMCEVDAYFDAERSLKLFAKSRNMKVTRDFTYFLDSTMVRVWGREASKFRELMCSKEWLKCGMYLTDSGCDFAKGVEQIWMSNSGTCVFPDFFRRLNAPKGMHGFYNRGYEDNGFAIIAGQGIRHGRVKQAELKGLKDTLLEILIGDSSFPRSWLK